MPRVVPPLAQVLAGATTPVSAVRVGAFDFDVAGPTVLDAYSGSNVADYTQQDARPWQLLIGSSGGGQQGPYAAVTVRAGARVALFGRAFTIDAMNLNVDPLPIVVRAYQTPALLPTYNVLDQGFTLPFGGTIAIPSYASRFRWDVPQSEKGSVYVQLLNPGGAVVARYAWNEQPSEGVPVGFASSITINGGSAGAGRLTFMLSI